MAWLSLVVVVVLFFAPEFGIGPMLAAQDIPITVTMPLVSVAFRVPFTGPLRLLAACMGAWLVLWQIPLQLDRWLGESALRENRPYKDFLQRLGLWEDLTSAWRPGLTLQAPIVLAKLLLGFEVAKAIGLYLLQALLDSVLPLFSSLLSSVTGGQIPFIISGAISRGLDVLLNIHPGNAVALVVLCTLVLIADNAFQSEKRSRYEYRIRAHQLGRKRKQQEIRIPATQ